tara:strand:- start:4189 stop:4461 length:273 start_codon:yes stop_codon:yes gene_type:complete
MNYVNIYLTDKAYGGREEGGWWYNYGEPFASIPVLPKETMDEVFERYTPYINSLNEGRPDISSVLSEGWFSMYKENHMAKAFPETTPHYE